MLSSFLTLGVGAEELQDSNCFVGAGGFCVDKPLDYYAQRLVHTFLHEFLDAVFAEEIDGDLQDSQAGVEEHTILALSIRTSLQIDSCFTLARHYSDDLRKAPKNCGSLVSCDFSIELLLFRD